MYLIISKEIFSFGKLLWAKVNQIELFGQLYHLFKRNCLPFQFIHFSTNKSLLEYKHGKKRYQKKDGVESYFFISKNWSHLYNVVSLQAQRRERL